MTAPTAVLGLVGLGAMGRNLGWRLAELGIPLAVYSYAAGETERFEQGLTASAQTAAAPRDLVRLLARPRTLLLMVTAGEAVDRVVDDLLPDLEAGDLIIDGGNSHFQDTIRRGERLRTRGIGYIGAGISGGEAGARHGASIMVGADARDYARVRPILESLAARHDGSICAARVGPGGAGHFVKMVHNGIEYALMQVIAEIWRTMTDVLGWDRLQQQDAFARFDQGPAASYLVGITSGILEAPDPEGDGYLLDHVSDRAAQKGTGRWTVEAALALGVPVPGIAAAVTERMISAATRHDRARPGFTADLPGEALESALLAGFVSSFAQGFALLAAASEAYDWHLDFAEIARIWQGGCIIRADLLKDVESAFRADPGLSHLLDAETFHSALADRVPEWRQVVGANVAAGSTAPCLSATLAWYDSISTARLPTRLIQAQRDCFGAHGFERTDRVGRFHASWMKS